MKNHFSNILTVFLLFIALFFMNTMAVWGQKAKERRMRQLPKDSLVLRSKLPSDSISKDSIHNRRLADSISVYNEQAMKELFSPVDTSQLVKQQDSIAQTKVLKEKFMPNPQKATWYALVFPGGGQIYNRKYWKLPIVYGGFVGCAYALNWNNRMYKDYKQAYLDIMDDDPNTKSYENFLPASVDIRGQESQFKERFRKRKDTFRRQRDLSIFAFIGVYALSVIDAYVDAELSNFDISHDLGLKIEPTLINNGHSKTSHSLGLHCSITF